MKKEDVFNIMIDRCESIVKYDAWTPSTIQRYSALLNCKGTHIHKNITFNITYTTGGGCGMGGYPPSITVIMVACFKNV